MLRDAYGVDGEHDVYDGHAYDVPRDGVCVSLPSYHSPLKATINIFIIQETYLFTADRCSYILPDHLR